MMVIGADVNINIDTSSILEATAITTAETENRYKEAGSHAPTGTEKHIKTRVSINIIKTNDFQYLTKKNIIKVRYVPLLLLTHYFPYYYS